MFDVLKLSMEFALFPTKVHCTSILPAIHENYRTLSFWKKYSDFAFKVCLLQYKNSFLVPLADSKLNKSSKKIRLFFQKFKQQIKLKMLYQGIAKSKNFSPSFQPHELPDNTPAPSQKF